MSNMRLNPQQKEAVEYNGGPLLIIAGAGSGKTKVLTERISYIIKQKWATPSQILALTFTEKASSEMQERVDEVLPIGYEYPTISTFHSFADQILKQEAIYLGIDSGYRLMTQSESYIFFRKHLYELPLKEFRPLGNPTKFISAMLSHFSRLQDEDVTPERYLEYANSLTDGEEKEQRLELANTFKVYSELKVKESVFDFADLITTVVKLFVQRPNILKKYHEKYKYILVDEYQDTNYTQNLLVNMLAMGDVLDNYPIEKRKSCNITVVGDDDQAIYKFRGAAISNILQFKQIYPDVKKVVLTQNYRSTQNILDVAYKLIKNNDPYRLEVTEKIDKRLIAQEKGSKYDVQVLRTNNSDFEAERIAIEILNLVGKGDKVQAMFNGAGQMELESSKRIYQYKDIAILARANNHLDEIVETLRYRGIPYKLGGARSLYQRQEIMVLISFLKLLLDYTDEVSMFNILNMPLWRFNPREIVDILKKARDLKISTYEVLEKIYDKEIVLKLTDNTYEDISKLVTIIRDCQKKVVQGGSAGQALFTFFEGSGLKDLYLNDSEGKYAFVVENTKKYFDMLEEFWKNHKGTNLYEYMDFLQYSMEVGESPSVDSSAFEEYDAVNLLTIHSSKGLEFPVVFVVNMVSDRFPSRDRQDAISIPNPLIKEILSEKGEDSDHIMEERRLCYVAFTRAKERLYITASDFYSLGKRKKKLSPFIYEALDENIIPNSAISNPNEDTISVPEVKESLDYQKLGIKIPNIFSYTQLHSYEMCPAQYKYEYVLKLPTPPSASLTFGSTVHKTLNQMYEAHKLAKEGIEGFNTYPTLEEVLAMYEKNWNSVGFEDKKIEKIRFESGKDLFKKFFDQIYSKEDKILYLEKDFQYAIDDFKIKGRIDRIDSVDGGVEIIDYKTGKAKDKKEASEDWQLLLYAIYVEDILKLSVKKASYIYVEHGKKVSVDLDMERKSELIEHIKEIVKKIREGDFSLPPGHICQYCKYKEICDDAII